MPAPGPDRGAPGRACVQINRICTHNERTRHDSTAAPNVIQAITENVCGRAWIYGTLML